MVKILKNKTFPKHMVKSKLTMAHKIQLASVAVAIIGLVITWYVSRNKLSGQSASINSSTNAQIMQGQNAIFTIGGKGGDAKAIGGGIAIGGNGGPGGGYGGGNGGDGGNVKALGQGSTVIGGDGGGGVRADGRGGKGAASSLRKLPLKTLQRFGLTGNENYGAGSDAPNSREYNRRISVLSALSVKYSKENPEVKLIAMQGVEMPPIDWVNNQLLKKKESFRVVLVENGIDFIFINVTDDKLEKFTGSRTGEDGEDSSFAGIRAKGGKGGQGPLEGGGGGEVVETTVSLTPGTTIYPVVVGKNGVVIISYPIFPSTGAVQKPHVFGK